MTKIDLSSIPYRILLKINIFGHQKYSIRGYNEYIISYNENSNFMTIREIIIDSFLKKTVNDNNFHNSYRNLSLPKKNLAYECLSSDYDSQFMIWISSN